jgi:subtilisin family serine protease
VPLVGLAALASCNASCPPAPPPNPNPGYDCAAPPTYSGVVKVAKAVPGRYIVVLKGTPPASARQALVSIEGVSEAKVLDLGYAARITPAALARVLADPNVAYVQEEGVKSVSPLPSTAPLGQAWSWGLDRVDQRDRPLDGDYSPGGDGAGVNVAIVDTGVADHPDFEGRLETTDCFSAYGFCADQHGHGTHVAGTAAGQKWGIAKKARLWIAKVLDKDGSGTDSSVIQGINWVVAKKQASPGQDWVINMSLGGSDSPALNQATCDAIGAGVTVAVAAGNESEDADRSSPARVVQAVTAGASDSGDNQAYFSNYGSLLDLYAPGVDIESAKPGGGTAVFSGTSMASPHVAGGAALFLGRHPGSSPAAVRNGIVAAASAGKLKGIGAGSPNLLLFVKE